jgi:hypothetical protein
MLNAVFPLEIFSLSLTIDLLLVMALPLHTIKKHVFLEIVEKKTS